MSPSPLEQSFYERNTRVVAFELIGKILVLRKNGTVLSGKIIETEAYFGAQDPASHACRGMTPRNRVMFGAPGISYVYFTYGNHHCLNVVTEKEHVPGAVLIRSLEPVDGIALMKKRRGNASEEQLTNGPGKLTQAFGITREHSGIDLTSGSFYIGEGEKEDFLSIRTAKRIGISRAQNELFRFYLSANAFVPVR